MKVTLSRAGAASLCAAAIGVSALAASGVHSAALADDRKNVVRTLDLSGFERIEIAGVYDLDVEVGPDYAVTLSGAEREMERVEAEVKNGALHLSRKEGKRRIGWGRQRGVKAEITLPSLSGLTVSGVVDGEVRGVDAESFSLDISGVGDMELEGECGAMEAGVSGVGDLDAKELECRTVQIDVSGVGDATVFASEAVEASVSGVGDIDVYGEPASVEKDGGMFAEITVH